MQFEYGIGSGASSIQSTRRRWFISLMAFLLGAALLVATASPALAETSGGEILQPGWDIFPDGSGTVSWVSDAPGQLQVTYNIDGGPAGATLDVGLIQTDVGDGVMLTGVVGGVFDFTGIVIGPYTREGNEVGPYNAWVFGEEFTTTDDEDESYGDGEVTVTLTANPGTYSVQFFVVPDATTTPNYESKGTFGTTAEVTVVAADVECEAGETCTFEGETYTGTIVCEDCDVFINDPGDNIADLTVLPNKNLEDQNFVITLISENRPRLWWRTAGVFVYEGATETRVGSCSFRESLKWFARGQEPGRNCSIIIPLRGERLKYILFWYDDPSFRFK